MQDRATEVPLDEYNRSILLSCRTTGVPSLYLYERIKERFAARDWRGVKQEMKATA